MNTEWPNEIELELATMAQGGDAVGRWEGRPVFASGGLPGEHVRIRLRDRQRAFARGDVIELLRAAPERVASFCPLESTCGAADWRSVEPSAQRRFKAAILREQLLHMGGLDVEVLEPAPVAALDATLGYRITAELHVADGVIGYFRPGTRRVAEVSACCLHHPLINAAVAALGPLLGADATVRGVTLRCSPATGEVVALLDGRGALRELAARWRRAFPALVGVLQASTQKLLDGRGWIEQRVGERRFHVSANSFFQINYRETEHMVERVRALLAAGPAAHVLDLYCGVGLFALSLAPEVDTVVGIEEWIPAVEDAIRSIRLNEGANARFQAGSAEDLLEQLGEPIDRVVLDPPRRGCAPQVLSALAALEPERIVYVSCHPGTLARDCKQLAASGYRIGSAEIIDMFPHTHHVESIVMLERA